MENNSGKDVYVDKTPRYYLILDDILKYFPEAKVLLISRNPIDVLNSIFDTWIGYNYLLLPDFKHDLLDGVKASSDHGADPRVFQVNYEALTNAPSSTLKLIFEFLEIPDDGTDRNLNQVEATKFGDPKIQDTTKVLGRKTGAWANHVTPQRWRFYSEYLELIGRSKFEAMGYDFEEEKARLKGLKPSWWRLRITLPLSFFLMSSRKGLKYRAGQLIKRMLE